MAKANKQIHYMVTRRFRYKQCPVCAQWTFVGIDSGTPYEVDPIPITIEGEMVALTQGRFTYSVDYGNKLFYRDHWRMQHKPRGCVFAAHHHGKPLLQYCEMQYLEYVDRNIKTVVRDALRGKEELSDAEEQSLLLLNKQLGAVIIDGEPPY